MFTHNLKKMPEELIALLALRWKVKRNMWQLQVISPMKWHNGNEQTMILNLVAMATASSPSISTAHRLLLQLLSFLSWHGWEMRPHPSTQSASILSPREASFWCLSPWQQCWHCHGNKGGNTCTLTTCLSDALLWGMWLVPTEKRARRLISDAKQHKCAIQLSYIDLIYIVPVNPSNAETTFVQTQGCKDFLKQSKPCHVGTHSIALTEYSQISTHMPGFQSLSGFLHHFVSAKVA